MSTPATLDDVLAEIRELKALVQPAWPEELTLEQAMRRTNHTCARTFHYWCKRKRVRPISRGRYSKRRLEAAMSA